MLVKELKEMLKDMSDDDKLMIVAPNSPPWIKNFVIQKVEDENEKK